MRPTPRGGGRKAKGNPEKSRSVLTGRQRVFRNPFPSRIPAPLSSKLDVSGPSVKSTVTKVSKRHTSASQTGTSPEGKLSRTPNAQLSDPEKREIKDKPHRWIESRVKRLDPAGCMEEINSLHYFERNAGCFALQIVAITDWGRKYMEVGFKYPIPVFPQFLFTPLLESHQGGAQVPVKPSQVNCYIRINSNTSKPKGIAFNA